MNVARVLIILSVLAAAGCVSTPRRPVDDPQKAVGGGLYRPDDATLHARREGVSGGSPVSREWICRRRGLGQ